VIRYKIYKGNAMLEEADDGDWVKWEDAKKLREEKEWLFNSYIDHWHKQFPKFNREQLEEQLRQDLQQAIK